jgi:hypothetical protein
MGASQSGGLFGPADTICCRTPGGKDDVKLQMKSVSSAAPTKQGGGAATRKVFMMNHSQVAHAGSPMITVEEITDEDRAAAQLDGSSSHRSFAPGGQETHSSQLLRLKATKHAFGMGSDHHLPSASPRPLAHGNAYMSPKQEVPSDTAQIVGPAFDRHNLLANMASTPREQARAGNIAVASDISGGAGLHIRSKLHRDGLIKCPV